jgi:hypothetical protein
MLGLEDSIKADVTETRCGGVDWIHTAQVE